MNHPLFNEEKSPKSTSTFSSTGKEDNLLPNLLFVFTNTHSPTPAETKIGRHWTKKNETKIFCFVI